jgi:hypothetical protein
MRHKPRRVVAVDRSGCGLQLSRVEQKMRLGAQTTMSETGRLYWRGAPDVYPRTNLG